MNDGINEKGHIVYKSFFIGTVKERNYSQEALKNSWLWIHHHLPLSLRAAVNSAWRRPLRCPQLGGCFLLSWRGGAAVRHRGVQHSAQSFSPQRLLEKCERHCHTWLRSRYSFLSLSISPSLGGMQRNSEKCPPFSVHVLWRQIVCVGKYLIIVFRKNLQMNSTKEYKYQILLFFVQFSFPQYLFSSQIV